MHWQLLNFLFLCCFGQNYDHYPLFCEELFSSKKNHVFCNFLVTNMRHVLNNQKQAEYFFQGLVEVDHAQHLFPSGYIAVRDGRSKEQLAFLYCNH